MRRCLLVLLCGLGAAVLPPESALGQGAIRFSPSGSMRDKDAPPRKFGDKPVARIWFSRINPTSSFGYFRRISEEMGMKGNNLFMIPSVAGGAMTMVRPNTTGELKGSLVYLAKGLIPSVANVSFEKVGDQKTFRQRVVRRKQMFGDIAELIGKGDKYEVRQNLRTMSATFSSPKKGDEEPRDGEPRQQRRVAIAFSVGSSSSRAAGDKPPKLPDLESLTISTFFRYHDGVLFESQAPELHTMALPKLEQLRLSKKQESFDLYADIDLSQIPKGLREVFWNLVKSQAGAFLQQYDDEPDQEYAIRRSSGEFTMAVTRAAVLDVDRIRFSLSFADGDKPLKADVVVDARRNSNLSRQLGEFSGGASRFGSLRKEKSPLTIASAWRMPENFRKLLRAVFDKGRTKLQQELSTDADSVIAIEQIFKVLNETVDSGAADAVVKLGGNAESGFGLYGGLRISGAAELADNMSTLLAKLPSAPENSVRVSRRDGKQFLSFRLDEVRVPMLSETEQLPAQLHFTVANSCLWFSVGGESSFEMLTDCVGKASERTTGAATSAAPFVLDMKLSDWLTDPESRDKLSGFSRVPDKTLQRFEVAVHRSLSNSFRFGGNIPGMKKPDMSMRDSYLAKAIKSGQDELHLEIDTSATRLTARAEVGEGIIKFFVARILEVQQRAMENIQISFPTPPGGEGPGSSLPTAPGGK